MFYSSEFSNSRMRSTMKILFSLKICFLFLAIKPAHAYLDAGTGTMILNALVAGIVGAGVTAKIYWEKIRLWFRKLSKTKKP